MRLFFSVDALLQNEVSRKTRHPTACQLGNTDKAEVLRCGSRKISESGKVALQSLAWTSCYQQH